MDKSFSIEEIKVIAVELAKEYGVEKIALFCSYARGEEKEKSDLDFVAKKGNIKGYIEFCSFVNALEERFGTHIDVITYNTLEQSLFKHSLGDEVVLYEQ